MENNRITWGEALREMDCQQYKASGCQGAYLVWCAENGLDLWTEESILGFKNSTYQPIEKVGDTNIHDYEYYISIAETIAQEYKLTSNELKSVAFITAVAERLNGSKLPHNQPEIWEKMQPNNSH